MSANPREERAAAVAQFLMGGGHGGADDATTATGGTSSIFGYEWDDEQAGLGGVSAKMERAKGSSGRSGNDDDG